MSAKVKKPLNKRIKDKTKELRVTLFASPEGRLLVTGVGLAFIFLAWLGLNFVYSPDTSQVIVGMTATHIMFGRAAAMSFGYSVGLGHKIVVSVNMMIETVLVFTLYPLFVFSWRHIEIIKRLKNFLEYTRRAAEANKDTIRKYGVLGLFAFVWFPFWMTGPVVGSVIGFMIGLPIWLNMTIVLTGTYIAIFGWAVLLREFHDRVAAYSPYAPLALVFILIGIVVGGHMLHERHHKSRQRKGGRKSPKSAGPP